MIAIEFWMNGKKLGIASLELGDFWARLMVKNPVDPVWFDIEGRDRETGKSVRWCHAPVKVNDEITLRLVDVPGAETHK